MLLFGSYNAFSKHFKRRQLGFIYTLWRNKLIQITNKYYCFRIVIIDDFTIWIPSGSDELSQSGLSADSLLRQASADQGAMKSNRSVNMVLYDGTLSYLHY